AVYSFAGIWIGPNVGGAAGAFPSHIAGCWSCRWGTCLVLSQLGSVLSQLSGVILPVLVIAGIGFIWARAGRRFDSVFLTDIVTNIGTPCLVAHSLTTLKVAPAALAQMFGAALLAIAGFCILGLITLKVLRLSANSYLPALM